MGLNTDDLRDVVKRVDAGEAEGGAVTALRSRTAFSSGSEMLAGSIPASRPKRMAIVGC